MARGRNVACRQDTTVSVWAATAQCVGVLGCRVRVQVSPLGLLREAADEMTQSVWLVGLGPITCVDWAHRTVPRALSKRRTGKLLSDCFIPQNGHIN